MATGRTARFSACSAAGLSGVGSANRERRWPLIEFDEYYAQAWQSGGIVEQAVDPSMADAADPRYADPVPGAVEHTPPRAIRGYANAVVAALVLGDSPCGSGIDSLERFE